TLLSYLHYLDEINLTRNLFKFGEGINPLHKPSKIYLENTNLIYLLARGNANRGNLRESFFANQVGFKHQLNFTDIGGFKVDDSYTFEIGEKNKTNKQIKTAAESFVVSDDITHGFHHKIPLWLFGFLY
ncbi:MAG: AAA family ATPase, partial [Sphingobacterium sp.]